MALSQFFDEIPKMLYNANAQIMQVSVSSPAILLVSTIFFLYYQAVLGYIISLILRPLIKRWLSRMNKGIAARHDQNIDIKVKLQKCQVQGFNLSPFVVLGYDSDNSNGGDGEQIEKRTFMLKLLLNNIMLRFHVGVKVNNEIYMNGTVSISLETVSVHLFSLGLFLLAYRQVERWLHMIRGGLGAKTIQGAGHISEAFSNESDLSNLSEEPPDAYSNDDDSFSQKTPFYMLNKIINGAEIIGLRVSTSAAFDGCDIKWTLRSKKIAAKLKTTRKLCQANVLWSMEGFKTRLRSNKSAKDNSSNHDQFYHCIQAQSMQTSIDLQSSEILLPSGELTMQTVASIKVYGTDHYSDDKRGDLNLSTSCDELSSLGFVMDEWALPLLELIRESRSKRLQSGTRKVETKTKNRRKRKNTLFAVESVCINLKASAVLRDGRILEDSIPSDPLCLTTDLQLNLIPSLPNGGNLSKVQLILSDTKAVQVPDPIIDRDSIELLQVDKVEISIEKNRVTIEESAILSNITKISLGDVSLAMKDAEDTEHTASLLVSSHRSIMRLLAKKTKKNRDEVVPERTQRSQMLSVSCKSCKMTVSGYSCGTPIEKGQRYPLMVFGKVLDIDIGVSSNLNGEKEITVKTSQSLASVAYVPHEALPTYTQCMRDLHGQVNDDNNAEQQNKYVKLLASVSTFRLSIAKSTGTTTDHNVMRTKITKIEASNATLKEYVNFFPRDDAFKMNEIINSDGTITLSIHEKTSSATVLQHIDVQTLCPSLKLLWSPIIQWYIVSIMKHVHAFIHFHIPKGSSKTADVIKKKVTRTVNVESNETALNFRVILGGTSIVDMATKELAVSVTNNETDTWDKPDILFKATKTTINLNESDFDVITFDSVRYFNGIRLATPHEVKAYCDQRSKSSALEEEIVTGDCGRPLVEIVAINVGENTLIDLPPELHFGKIIEDMNKTLRTMKDGLVRAKLRKSRDRGDRKYQLMDISLDIPSLDLHCLEAEKRSMGKFHKHLRFGKPKKHNAFLDRWRFLLKGFKVQIQRKTPPDVTQSQLRDLDEDKTRRYLYGPMIQGGYFHISFDRVINTLHPLNLVTPLGDITNWQIKGLIYLASLNSKMENLVDGRNYCVPVRCHHMNSLALQSTQMACGCDYAVTLSSDNLPVKIYYDLSITSDRVHATYGDIIMPSISGLMKIINRLIPKEPFVDPRDTHVSKNHPPLEWWDNLRYQFHGRFQWKMESMSMRWLLDTVPRYDWSILLTSKDFLLSHSAGNADLDMDRVIISIPDSSYHMIDALPTSDGYKTLHHYLQQNKPGLKRLRHPFILFPKFGTQFNFKWAVSESSRNHSSMHHNVYMTDELAFTASPNDKFQYFRSRGWDIDWKFQLKKTETFDTWIALRGDVLPWITHKSPRPRSPPSEDDEDALPRVNSIKINMDVSALKIATWFDEKVDSNVSENPDASLEGILLQVPKIHYSRCGRAGNSIDLYGTIRAAILDGVRDYDSRQASSTDAYTASTKLMNWTQKQYPLCFYEINSAHSLRIFTSLQTFEKKLKTLDYLLQVDQIKIQDRSLDDIRQRSGNKELSKRTEAPWTVLVAGMKLLWTIEIRDSVVSIVKDVLFAINFMQVNSRGTPQLLDAELKVESSPQEEMNTSESSATIGDLQEDESGHDSVELIADESAQGVQVMPVASGHNPTRPKSHLDYLLKRSDDSIRQSIILQKQKKSHIPEAFMRASSIFHIVSAKDAGHSTEAVVPTFDLHLSNPQIQFYSEKTGGSIIIGIRGAYIEGKKFTQLLAKKEAFEKDDIRLETLFRRTEFIYTLDKMELFSVSNSVDVSVGLQWLSLKKDHNGSKRLKGDGSKLKKMSLETITEGISHPLTPVEETEQLPHHKSWRTFPKGLEIFDTKDFTIPFLGKAIMDPSTFKTRQEFYRPPIDLTKEELDEVIEENLIAPLEIDREYAINRLDFFVDELSFHLDSYQFSTTLDVVRNTMLEPAKPREERYYQKSQGVSNNIDGKDVVKTDISALNVNRGKEEDTANPNKKSEAFDEQKRKMLAAKSKNYKEQLDSHAHSVQVLLKETNKNKKWREDLRRVANEITRGIDEQKRSSREPSARYIEYNICKAKWKIAGGDDDLINDAEINFTDFKGVHDFTADGSVNSRISLEDMHVTSHKPCKDAQNFPDPKIIVKTLLGEKRSQCQRCGLDFDRASNEVTSCRFHPGEFKSSSINGMQWSCCGKNNADAVGCISRPHTGAEKAIDIRFEAFPRVVEGMTLYKSFEANVYPGVTHKTVVQLTKSLTKSLMNYFLGDPDDLIKEADLELKAEERREIEDLIEANESISYTNQDSQSLGTGNLDQLREMRQSRRFLLFGETFDESTQSQSQQIVKSNAKPTKEDGTIEKGTKTVEKEAEMIFLRNWNIGDININLSVAGFNKIIDIKDLPLVIPSFQRHYKIGSTAYLVKKPAIHLIKSLLSSGIGILKVKLGAGKVPRQIEIEDGNLDASEKIDPTESADDILLAPPKIKQKKKKNRRWTFKRDKNH